MNTRYPYYEDIDDLPEDDNNEEIEDEAPYATCFPVGTKVLMSNKIYKNIEEVKIDDLVIGLDNLIHKVLFLDKTKLGSNRSLLKFKDNSLKWSSEHPLWVKVNNDQYFGTFDKNNYLTEMSLKTNWQFGLRIKPPFTLLFNNEIEFAHTTGWKKQQVLIDRKANNNLDLYHLAVEGGTMIVNNYVVSAFADDTKWNYDKFDWQGLI